MNAKEWHCPDIHWSEYANQPVLVRLSFNILFYQMWLLNNTIQVNVWLHSRRLKSIQQDFHIVALETYPAQKRIIPWPIWAPLMASLAVPKPSSLQTTLAAVISHMWSHTVPHFPSRSTSTRPSPRRGPAFRRTSGWEDRKGSSILGPTGYIIHNIIVYP